MSAPRSDRVAIRQIIRSLKKEGYALHSVADGENEFLVLTEAEAVLAITAVDDAFLYVHREADPEYGGWVRFVMGNEPFEVAADWTLTLSHVLDPLTESWDQ